MELLVAGTITIILAGIIVGIVSNVLTTANRATGSLLSGNQAKLALDYLAQDLQSAVMRRDGNVWLAATVQPDQSGTGDADLTTGDWNTGTPKPGASESLVLDPVDETDSSTYRLADYRFGMAGIWLRMFTVEPDSNDGDGNLSTVRAVAYQIVRNEVRDGGSLRYSLFRSSVSPDESFSAGFDLFYESDGTTVSAYNTANGGQQVPGNVRKPRVDYLLANNVVDFGIRLWERTSTSALVLRFPQAALNCGFAATTATDVVPPEPSEWAPVENAVMSYGFPEVAEVFLRVLTDEGAKQIENLELGRLGTRPADYDTDGEWWWAIAEANSEVYTRRIEIKGRPL